jgi:hypothetical protein
MHQNLHARSGIGEHAREVHHPGMASAIARADMVTSRPTSAMPALLRPAQTGAWCNCKGRGSRVRKVEAAGTHCDQALCRPGVGSASSNVNPVRQTPAEAGLDSLETDAGSSRCC